MKHELLLTNPIAKKLQLKPGKRWLLHNAPDNYLATLEPLPGDVEIVFTPDDRLDGVQLFIRNSADLKTNLESMISILKPDTIFWITYPKKSSGIKSDLQMMGNWDELAKYGLRIVSAASINKTWTALRVRPQEQSKLSDTRNEEIRKNEYSNYIDVDNKQVILPQDMQQVLGQSQTAMAFYQSLSYSNKKEYVIWILSAKQEKTKDERMSKLVDKLLNKKKNPSEK